MKRGKLISFSGIDGSGKTTQVGNLSYVLQKMGYSVKTVGQFETPVGQKCREILSTEFDPYVRAFLFALDHYAAWEKTSAFLLENDFVIIDRSLFCAIAYSVPRGLTEDWILSLYEYLPRPDMAILLDVPIEIALERKSFDSLVPEKTPDFLSRVRNYYLCLAKRGWLSLVNGNLSVGEVTEHIMQLLVNAKVNQK